MVMHRLGTEPELERAFLPLVLWSCSSLLPGSSFALCWGLRLGALDTQIKIFAAVRMVQIRPRYNLRWTFLCTVQVVCRQGGSYPFSLGKVCSKPTKNIVHPGIKSLFYLVMCNQVVY